MVSKIAAYARRIAWKTGCSLVDLKVSAGQRGVLFIIHSDTGFSYMTNKENTYTVECGKHGSRRPAYVCQHLNTKHRVGFYEPTPSHPDVIQPDDDLEAWCDECEKVRAAEGEWNDTSEAFANIRLVCDKCFFEMKMLNEGKAASGTISNIKQ